MESKKIIISIISVIAVVLLVNNVNLTGKVVQTGCVENVLDTFCSRAQYSEPRGVNHPEGTCPENYFCVECLDDYAEYGGYCIEEKPCTSISGAFCTLESYKSSEGRGRTYSFGTCSPNLNCVKCLAGYHKSGRQCVGAVPKTCKEWGGHGCTDYANRNKGSPVEDYGWCWDNGWREYCSNCDYCVKCIGDYKWNSTFSSCKLPPIEQVPKIPTEPVCGNGDIEPGEECDDGTNNKYSCSVSYGESCTYCHAIDCDWRTVQGAYCGDGECNIGNEDCSNCWDDCGCEGSCCSIETHQIFVGGEYLQSHYCEACDVPTDDTAIPTEVDSSSELSDEIIEKINSRYL